MTSATETSGSEMSGRRSPKARMSVVRVAGRDVCWTTCVASWAMSPTSVGDELAARKIVVPDGEGARVQGMGRRGRVRSVADAHRAQVHAHVRLDPRAHRGVQRAAAALSDDRPDGRRPALAGPGDRRWAARGRGRPQQAAADGEVRSLGRARVGAAHDARGDRVGLALERDRRARSTRELGLHDRPAPQARPAAGGDRQRREVVRAAGAADRRRRALGLAVARGLGDAVVRRLGHAVARPVVLVPGDRHSCHERQHGPPAVAASASASASSPTTPSSTRSPAAARRTRSAGSPGTISTSTSTPTSARRRRSSSIAGLEARRDGQPQPRVIRALADGSHQRGGPGDPGRRVASGGHAERLAHRGQPQDAAARGHDPEVRQPRRRERHADARLLRIVRRQHQLAGEQRGRAAAG